MDKFNFHNNAGALILAAAERSGLLKEVAEFLHWHEKRDRFAEGDRASATCLACYLLDDLTEAFDDHTGLPVHIVEATYGEGVGMYSETSAGELKPFLLVPFQLPKSDGEVADAQ